MIPVEHGKIPTVAIVGRPNVGKSSLFNAIIGRRLAIVHQESGVTRDRLAAPAKWNGVHFQIVDTGGLGAYIGEKKGLGIWDNEIGEQVEIAIASADLLVFTVDLTEGVTNLDSDIARKLRACGKKIFVAANKADNPRRDNLVADFAKLGFDEIFPVSCTQMRGINQLLGRITGEIKDISTGAPQEPELRIAVVGRPNVGKSSIINRLLGEKRVMVSDIPGTTRDSIDVNFELNCADGNISAVLIDTAGLRQKRKADTAVEIFSIMRSEKAVERAQIVLFIVEAGPDGVTAQDKRIADMIVRSNKACIIIANKWDLCSSLPKKEVHDEIRWTLTFMSFAPVIFASAATGFSFEKINEMISEVRENMKMQIPTSVVNKIIRDACEKNNPSSLGSGRHFFKIYYATMTGNEPPRFLLFVNDPKICPANYLAYLTNYLRDRLGLTGLPIKIDLRAREKVISPVRRNDRKAQRPRFESKNKGANYKKHKPRR